MAYFQGGQQKRYKDSLKASLKGFNIPSFQISPGNRVRRIEQSGTALLESGKLLEKQRVFVKLKESLKSTKPVAM